MGIPIPKRATPRIVVAALLALVVSAPASPAAHAAPAPTQLKCSTISSKILGRAVNYCVDLPADYAASGKRYPVLYFLHGMFENYRAWDENGGKDVLDGLAAAGKIGPMIVVLPDAGNSFYVNSYDGKDRYEDFFIQELVPFIDKQYRTIPDAQHRGVSGVSMGGYGALHLAMLHSGVFGSVSAQGAALVPKFPHPVPTTGRWGFYARILEHSFGNPLNEAYWDANNPLELAKDPAKFAGLQIYFDCGTDDRYGFEHGAELLDEELNKNDVPHVFALRPGNHGWDYLHKYMKYSLMFHWRVFTGKQSVSTGPAQ